MYTVHSQCSSKFWRDVCYRISYVSIVQNSRRNHPNFLGTLPLFICMITKNNGTHRLDVYMKFGVFESYIFINTLLHLFWKLDLTYWEQIMGHINLIRFLSPFYTRISDHYISGNHKCFCLFYLYDIKRLKRINMNANTVWWLYNTFCIGDFETNVFIVVYFILFLFVCFDDCNIYQNRYCSNPKYKWCLVKDNFELDVSLLMSWWCDLLCFWNNVHLYALCDNKWIWNIKQVSKRLTFPLSTPIYHWMLFMIVSEYLL